MHKPSESAGGVLSGSKLILTKPSTAAWAGLLIIPLLFAYLFFTSYSRWDHAYREASREVTNIAAGLEQQTKLAYTAVDIELQTAAAAARLAPSLLRDGDASQALLDHVLHLLPVVRSLQFIDPNGTIRRSAGIQSVGVYVGDREYFAAARDAASGAHFGRPIVSRVNGVSGVPISRRIDDAGSGFAGVFVAIVDPAALARLLGEVDIGPRGALSILTSAGLVLARSPAGDAFAGKDISESPFFRANLQSNPAGVFIGSGAIDGVTRLIGYRVLSAFPLIVLAGMDLRHIEAIARAAILPELLIAAVLGIGICGLTILLVLALRRSEGTHTRLLDAIDSLPDALAFFDEEERLVHSNPAYRAYLPDRLSPDKNRFLDLVPHFARQVRLPNPLGATLDEWTERRLAHFRRPGPPFPLQLKDGRWIRIVDRRLSDGSAITMRTDVTAPTLAFEAQERLSRQQQIVGTLSQFALTALDPQLLREKAVALVAEGLGLEMATVLERDEGAKTFHVHAVIGMPLQAGGYLVPMGDGLAAAALAAAEPFVFEDAASDRRFRLHPALEKAEVRSGIVVKIAGHRAPLGLLSAFSRAPRGFDQDQVGFVKAMAFVLSTAAERRQAEMILSQAQRLDSLGQLTGGIAHDFNNLLTVIAGHAEVLADEVPGGSEHAEMIRSIRSAAKRAAELTHQLLAFARGQTLQTSDIEINELVREMQPLLRRTIEENVELRTILDQSLPRCRTDRAQLSAAIMNMVINARDAMPAGGAITIESGMTSLDQAYADENPEVEPGDYVVLSVTDTGTGMAPEVASRVFEPFFTTKPVGKGTGLGLSMVYGFMKQSGGHVKIYSEVGVGTSVKLYIPIATGHSVQDAAGSAGNMPRGHGERILVVEDEIQVRNFAAGQLKRLGYTVIEACDGREALELLRGGAAVDLVFSDMIMPGGISGPQLARELGGMRPGLRVIFTSGYPAGAIQHGAEGELGRFSLLTKPYTVAQLARQIRQSLDGAESDR